MTSYPVGPKADAVSANVRIVMIGHGRGEVYVDGHKVEGVRRVEFSAAVGTEANVLTLEMIPERVEIEGAANLVLPLTPSEKFSDDYKRWLMLPWWQRWFGPSPMNPYREGPTRTQVKRYGSNGPPPCPRPPPPASPPRGRHVTRKYRDASTGTYVSEDYAKANPDTTVAESDSRVVDLERRVRELEEAVAYLLGAPRPVS